MNLFATGKKRTSSLYQWFRGASIIKKIIVVAVIFLLGWFIYSRTLGVKRVQPQYQTAQVTRDTLVTNVTASGTVTAAGSVSISSNATGIVSQVYVANGDTVTQGEKIADITLDADAAQKQAAAYASYLGAQATLDTAKSKMNSLQAALFRTNQAFVKDAGQPNPDTADPKYIEENADWLQAEADYTNQKNIINQAQANVTSTWLSYQLISSTITAPTSGVITNLTLTPGLSISGSGNSSSSTNSNSTNTTSTSNSSSSSTSLGTITLEGGQLEATVNLSEIDVTKVATGDKVTMTLDAFPDKTYTGRVSAINTNGTVSSNVTTYPTTITFDTSDSKIYPNMAVDAKIITDVKDNVLLVPTTAVQTANGQSTVRVLKNGQVQTVDVTVGKSSDTETEITSGLNEGDTVVTGTVSSATRTGATSSPFGGTGFGGLRGGGGFGGGAGAGANRGGGGARGGQ